MPEAAKITPKYKRVLLKISGEGFCKEGGFGIDSHELENIARQCIEVCQMGVQLAIVVGGGNFIRGATFSSDGHIGEAFMPSTICGGAWTATASGERLLEILDPVTTTISSCAVAGDADRARPPSRA